MRHHTRSTSRRPTLLETLETRQLLAFTPGPLAWSQVAIKGSGMINGIDYSKAEANLAYVYTDMGGAYRWDNAASQWKALNDWSRYNDWSVQQLGAEGMVSDPTNANRVFMVAGTYNSPAAVLRSADRGNTWSRWDAPWDNTNNRPSWRVNGNGNGRNGGNRMAIDPNLTTTLYYGTRLDGLWRSNDRAATWSRVGSFPSVGDSTGAAAGVGIAWVLFDKSSGNSGVNTPRMYVGVSTTTGTKIYRSNDAGVSWTAVANQPTSSTLIPIRAALAADGATMYLTYSNGPGPNDAGSGAVYKVVNPATATPTWTQLSLPVLSSGGWSGVSIDAANPSRLLVTTLDRWGATDDIYRSIDGGTTWKALNIRVGIDNSSAPYAAAIWPHWLGDVQIDPFNPNVAMVTTGNGLYRTSDLTNLDTNGTVHWRFFNDGIEQSAVSELQSPPSGTARLYSAIGDRDGFRHDDLTVSPPQGFFGQSQGFQMGSNGDIAVAWTDANQIIRSGSASPYVQYSTNNGTTWTRWPAAPAGSNGGGRVEMSPDGTKAIFDPAGGAISYATRTGSTWSAWATSTFSGGATPADANLTADLTTAGTFYALSAGSLFRSTNGGATFSLVASGLSTNARSLRSVPNNPGHLLMSTWFSSEGLLRSTDGGATWTRLAASAVTQALLTAAGAPKPGNTYPSIYVAGTVSGKTGYFRSDDQGASWTELSDTAHQFGIPHVLQGDAKYYGRLYVGTDGRGIQLVDFADRTAPQVALVPTYDVNSNTISVRFSEDVSGVLDASDVVITRVADATTIPTSLASYDAVNQTATFLLPATMSNGDYDVRLVAAGISDAAGNAMVADSTSSFFILAGDANRDRTVDFSDLLILAQNYGSASGSAYTSGDFNRDGGVNFEDLLVLAQAYGNSQQLAAAIAAPVLPKTTRPTSRRSNLK